MATKSDISKQTFENLLEEQKGQEILKWSQLEEGQIYEIIKYEFINTRNGKSCIITLSDDTRVWSPLALTNSLEKLSPESIIAYVRPSGKKESKKTGHMYNNFDLVVQEATAMMMSRNVGKTESAKKIILFRNNSKEDFLVN